MGRILGIDYGKKRCGVAITDILKISINPLKVVAPELLLDFVKSYIDKEAVEKLVIGWPRHKDGVETYLTEDIRKFLSNFAKMFPEMEIIKVDEAFSSREAKELIWQSGAKKKKRREKSLVDQMSAVLLIKRYLDSI